jgi:hypothetical protein
MGWGYAYIIDLDGIHQDTVSWPMAVTPAISNLPSYEAGESNYAPPTVCSTTSGSVSVTNLQAGGDGCGPCLMSSPNTNTPMHCDRTYQFGKGYNSFFQGKPQLYLVSGAHDPNDHASVGTIFAEVHFTGTVALHVFVPTGETGTADGHAHTASSYPNYVSLYDTVSRIQT